MGNRKRVNTRFSVGKKGLQVRHTYEDSFEYWGPYAAVTLIFIAAFAISGYFFFHNHSTPEKLEVLIGPITLFIAALSAINGKQLVFWPAFIIGCLWGTLSLFTSVTFDIASYTFFYCCTITLMLFLDLIKAK